jgi:hypothetical protein
MDNMEKSKAKFIDLGLPSGVLWCDRNVGAVSPKDYGLYFSWGNTDGHTDCDGYDFYDEYDESDGAKIHEDLRSENDAAHKYMGEPCRMPSVEECLELVRNCDSEWVVRNGIKGRMFTSRINGNSVFFPASGGRYGTQLSNRGAYGGYWSSSLHSAPVGYSLYFDSGGVNPANSSSRFYGFSVRAVQNCQHKD